MRRTGGSRSSPRRGDRRLAPRGFRSGRRSRADAEARRHCRLLAADPVAAGLSQSLGVRRSGLRPGDYPGSRGRVRDRPGPRRTAEPRLRGGHREEAVQADVPHPARGALERRGYGQRVRLPVHPRAVLLAARGPRRGLRQGAVGPCARCEDIPGGASRAVCGLAPPAVQRRTAAPRARGTRRHEGLERPDRQPEDGWPDRQRPVPRRELGAWQAAHARQEPAVLGATHHVPRPLRGQLRTAGPARSTRTAKARRVRCHPDSRRLLRERGNRS